MANSRHWNFRIRVNAILPDGLLRQKRNGRSLAAPYSPISAPIFQRLKTNCYSSRQAEFRERHLSQALSCRREDRVVKRGGKRRQARLADSGGGRLTGHDVNVGFARRNVHARNLVGVKVGLVDDAVGGGDFAVECNAGAHRCRALKLLPDRYWV